MTAQMRERLILEGAETWMALCPPLPEGHPRISVDDHDIEADDFECFTTACWRSYQGTWEIKSGRLFLIGLRGRLRLRGEDPLPADWFSGVIRIPRGALLQHVHMGFGSVYEEEVHVKIEKGTVVKSRILDNRGKDHDPWLLGLKNLPGFENHSPGDDEL